MSNVLPLFPRSTDRTCQLRHWFVEQGMERAGHVAAVSVSITSDGVVNTKGCGIEPEHAVLILDELNALVTRLEAFLVNQQPELMVRSAVHQPLPPNVVLLRR